MSTAITGTNLPEGLIVDIGPVNPDDLPPTVFVNGRRYMPADEEPGPRTWRLPEEPGPEVTAVRDADGELWQRTALGRWDLSPSRTEVGRRVRVSSPAGVAWSDLMLYGPLTDASPP